MPSEDQDESRGPAGLPAGQALTRRGHRCPADVTSFLTGARLERGEDR